MAFQAIEDALERSSQHPHSPTSGGRGILQSLLDGLASEQQVGGPPVSPGPSGPAGLAVKRALSARRNQSGRSRLATDADRLPPWERGN